MKRGRAASQLGIASWAITSTEVTATSKTELGTGETGVPVWADTQAKQGDPESSDWVCTCAACAHTANRMSVIQTAQAPCFQRNFSETPVMVNSLNAELYNEFRIIDTGDQNGSVSDQG
jgi:hypothetical protein